MVAASRIDSDTPLSYWRAVITRRRKLRWFSGQLGSLVIAMLVNWIGLHELITNKGAAILVAYVVCGGVVAIVEIISAAKRVYEVQAGNITALRQTNECKDGVHAADKLRMQGRHRDEVLALEGAVDSVKQQLRIATEPRPRIHVVFDWRGSLTGCYEPFTIKNDSDVAAQKIQVGPIRRERREGYAEAIFPIIAYLTGPGETKIWPIIDGADTQNGHPDFAKFMNYARYSAALTAAEEAHATSATVNGTDVIKSTFMAGTALPFTISYQSLDGRPWKTNAHIKIGGEWGPGRIVIETLGFD